MTASRLHITITIPSHSFIMQHIHIAREEVPAVTPPPTIFTATAEPLGITCKCGRFVHYTPCQSNQNGKVALCRPSCCNLPWSRRERRGLLNDPVEARVEPGSSKSPTPSPQETSLANNIPPPTSSKTCPGRGPVRCLAKMQEVEMDHGGCVAG